MSADVSFVLCRILGNDLPPLHRPEQTVENLEFILRHEPELPSCRKVFLLNRVVDRERRDRLAELVLEAGHRLEEIEIDPRHYRRLRRPRERGAYLTNNNGGRNHAVELGLVDGDVALPFDGQTFFTLEGWRELRAEATAHPECPAFVVPMVRLLDNQEALGPRLSRDEHTGPTEPQLAISRACPERFDESVPYGRGPKVEMLLRLGVRGPWDGWQGPRWTEMRARPRSPLAGRARRAGFVYRLASGNPDATLRVDVRQHARKQGVDALVALADEAMGVPRGPAVP